MKWSYHSDAADVAARLTMLRSRFGRTQQLIALALSLALCALALLAVSGRMNLTQASTAPPSTLPADGSAAVAAGSTSAPVLAPGTAAPASSAQPAAKFSCGTGTAETRYVADRNGAIVFDSVEAAQTALGTPLPFRSAVQVYGTVTGRLTGNSDKWYAVRYGERCAYIWADPATSRLSTTRPP